MPEMDTPKKLNPLELRPWSAHEAPAPQVSWLLCTHQSHALLHRAIDSCLAQTLADFELLIVVNGPQAPAVASALRLRHPADPRVRVFETPVHLLNFSLSWGLHLARAAYVARMDADDFSSPDRLQRQWSFMEEHPQVAVLGSSYNVVDAAGQVHGHVDEPQSNAEIRRQLRFRNPLCHPSLMLIKAAVLPLGGYLGGRHAEDYDLWLRLALDTQWEFANLPERLLSYSRATEGTARGSHAAYANAAAALGRNFLMTWDLRYLLGALMYAGKTVVRGKSMP